MKIKFPFRKHNHPLVRILLVFLLITVFQGNSYSQERIISGIVTDAVTAEPLPGVNIIIEGTTIRGYNGY